MRRKLATAVAAIAVVVAVTGTAFAGGQAQSSSTASKPKSNDLHIMSWWTTGGEVLGLHALITLFEKDHPGVKVINDAIAGSRGSNMKAVLATRVQAGNPPDSFQVLAGAALKGTWVVSGQIDPTTFLYKEQGWSKVFPPSVLDQVTSNGQQYAVPVDMHRTNVLWYNQKIFNKYNLSPPATMNDFFKVAKVLSENGVIPLSFGDKAGWEPVILLENVILAELGPNGYMGLFNGNTKWDSPAMIKVLDDYVRILKYVNTDYSGLTGADEAQYTVDGRTAMTVMGDWISGYYRAKKYTAHVDYGWAVAPGTKGTFVMVSDTFVLPKKAKHRNLAIDWLKVVGSRAGQDAFNPLKGSISPRLDANTSLYSQYSQGALKDFKTDTLVPSLSQGMAINDTWFQDIENAMSEFIVNKNVTATAAKLAEIARNDR